MLEVERFCTCCVALLAGGGGGGAGILRLACSGWNEIGW